MTDLDSGYPQLRFTGKKNIRKLVKGKYPPVQTTFFTEDGPAARSIWMDKESSEPGSTLIVKEIKDERVVYVAGGFDDLAVFMELVEQGRYLLVGTVSHPECHTAENT